MRCTRCRNLFSERFDARLAATDAAEFEAHLAACGACAAEYAAFRRVFDAVRALPARRAAPPFRRPAELPAARPAASGALVGAGPGRIALFRSPAFRAAASLVVAVGLGLSHGYAYRTGQAEGDGSDRFRPETAKVPVLSPSSALTLPSRLRDHVEATDLFVRTASQMPAEARGRGRELLKADFARLELGRFTSELRNSDLASDDRYGPELRSYFASVGELCDRLGAVFADDASGLDRVRDAVAASPVTRDLAVLRPVVASFGSADTFKGRTLAKDGWAKDERALYESRDARLFGDLRGAVAGYKRFGGEFRSSAFAPLADYLLAEAYVRGGNYAPAAPLLTRLESRGTTLLPNDNLASLVIVFGDGVLANRREVAIQTTPTMTLRFAPTPVGLDGKFVRELGTWDVPSNALDYLEARGLTIRPLTDAFGARSFEILRNGAPLLVRENVRLFSAVRTLILSPDLDPALIAPTEFDERSTAGRTPVVR
jgi:hypothetical protein